MTNEVTENKKLSIIDFMASKYGMERKAFEAVMKETIMPGNVKNEEFVAFLMVAKEYDLNPLTKQIYAFAKGGKVFPIVPVDGWAKIINSNPQFDGLEFNDVVENGKVVSIECKIYRKDRLKATPAIEYLDECFVSSNPAWKQWPRRMLRHKALIQAARYAFGLGGIYDPDEADRIKQMKDITPKPLEQKTNQEKFDAISSDNWFEEAKKDFPDTPDRPKKTKKAETTETGYKNYNQLLEILSICDTKEHFENFEKECELDLQELQKASLEEYEKLKAMILAMKGDIE